MQIWKVLGLKVVIPGSQEAVALKWVAEVAKKGAVIAPFMANVCSPVL